MVKLKLQYFGHLMRKVNSLEKTLMLGKIEGRKRRGRQRMRWLDGIGWHHQLDRHEFEQAPRVGDGQGNLVYLVVAFFRHVFGILGPNLVFNVLPHHQQGNSPDTT